MAALPRPSLRSAARKSPDPGLRPTDVELPTKRLTRGHGKRTRDVSQDNESNASSKRHKNSPQDPTRPPSRKSKETSFTALPFRDKQRFVPNKAVTQVVERSRNPPPYLKNTSPTAPKTTQSTQTLSKAKNPAVINNLSAPDVAPAADKRSLRSHDGGSRSKSELSLYFPNYDDLISIEPKRADSLTPDTMLFVTDEDAKPGGTDGHPKIRPNEQASALSRSKIELINPGSRPMTWPDRAFSDLTDAVTLDLSQSFPKPSGRMSKKDPLNDDIYIKVHRRLERQEKQLRNIEKERAMHEKVQLERLLDGLRGHDWLRVIGISGITDGEKKAYEPKRDHLIREVRILLEKFRLWKEEEKRRKVEKEEEEEYEEDDDEEGEEDRGVSDEDGDAEGLDEGENGSDDSDDPNIGDDGSGDEDDSAVNSTSASPPDFTEIDASAARQLQLEADRASQQSRQSFSWSNANSSGGAGRSRKPKAKAVAAANSAPLLKQQQITSFFSKPYLRDAAIGNHRRGRAQFAFGHPVPEPEQRAFELPADILTEAALVASERKQRASKRGRDQ